MLVFSMAACGSQESSTVQGEPGAAPPPVSSTEPLSDIPKAAMETISPQVRSCLDLVGGGRFAEAIPACTQALEADPKNADVQTALNTAKEKSIASQAEAVAGQAKEAMPGGEAEAEKTAKDALGQIAE
jgi:hypothetical protein